MGDVEKLRACWALLREAVQLPRLRIDLRADAVKGRDPHYHALTESYFRHATSRHPKMPLMGRLQLGVAVCQLPTSPDGYRSQLPSTAQRNIRKAERAGYRFERIDYNAHLDAITDIHRSSQERQGRALSAQLLATTPPTDTPASNLDSHDYPFFGVFHPDGRLVAYACCFVAGELCSIDRIFGHHDHLSAGVVPLLIARIAEDTIQHRPGVRHLTYGTYFGASPTLRRFKRKFQFVPHRVTWLLSHTGVPMLLDCMADLLTDSLALDVFIEASPYLV